MDKPMAMSQKDAPNPLQQVDRLYEQLVSHYGDAADREIRAASKLLLVALEKFQQHGGPAWINLVEEYVALLEKNPNKFKRIIKCQRYPGMPQPAD